MYNNSSTSEIDLISLTVFLSLTRVFIFPGLHVISLVWHVFLLLCFNMFYCLIPGLHVISLVWLCVNAQTPTVRKWMGITGCRSYLYFQPIFWTVISFFQPIFGRSYLFFQPIYFYRSYLFFQPIFLESHTFFSQPILLTSHIFFPDNFFGQSYHKSKKIIPTHANTKSTHWSNENYRSYLSPVVPPTQPTSVLLLHLNIHRPENHSKAEKHKIFKNLFLIEFSPGFDRWKWIFNENVIWVLASPWTPIFFFCLGFVLLSHRMARLRVLNVSCLKTFSLFKFLAFFTFQTQRPVCLTSVKNMSSCWKQCLKIKKSLSNKMFFF